VYGACGKASYGAGIGLIGPRVIVFDANAVHVPLCMLYTIDGVVSAS
jgi:hypothetical protein